MTIILQNFYIISLGYLAGRMRSIFIHHQDFVSVSFFMLVLPKTKMPVEQFSLFPFESFQAA